MSGKSSLHLSFHPDASQTTIMPGMYANLKRVASVKIPDNIKFIDAHAFANCPNLTQVIFEGTNLPKVHPLAFTGCNLKNSAVLQSKQGKKATASKKVKNKIKSDKSKAN